jgi:hypothetical protein
VIARPAGRPVFFGGKRELPNFGGKRELPNRRDGTWRLSALVNQALAVLRQRSPGTARAQARADSITYVINCADITKTIAAPIELALML